MPQFTLHIVRRYTTRVTADTPHDAVLLINPDYDGPLNGARLREARATRVVDDSGNEYEIEGRCDACELPIFDTDEAVIGTDCRFHKKCAEDLATHSDAG